MTDAPEVTIHTDGCCLGNPGPGGWGAVLECRGRTREIYGGEPGRTTNNRMELVAAIRALKVLDHPCAVELYTDSQYLQRGAPDADEDEPAKANKDLWREIAELGRTHRIRWHWVRRGTDARNVRADRLAMEAAKRAREGRNA